LPDINNTESLRAWFRTCPVISATNRFGVDYLTEHPTEYAIYAVPSTIAYRRNILGKEIPRDIQTQNYIFASREAFGADVQQNLINLGFYQEIVAWIIQQNNDRNFPPINEGTVQSIVPSLTAYPAAVGSNAAKYQIQLKLTYRIKS